MGYINIHSLTFQGSFTLLPLDSKLHVHPFGQHRNWHHTGMIQKNSKYLGFLQTQKKTDIICPFFMAIKIRHLLAYLMR